MFHRELTTEQKNRQELLKNRAWLDEHFQSVQKEYPEKWVAVLDGKIAFHDTEVKILEQKVERREQETVIIRIPSEPISKPI